MRRDSRGRRIGKNLWRDLITDAWRMADHAWFLRAEAETLGYATELAEYRAENPRPNLGHFMRELAPSWTGPIGQQYAAHAA
jgi:hypothetical protein